MSRNTMVTTPDGEPDDIAIHNPTLVRVERMARSSFWIAVYDGDKTISMFFNAKKKRHLSCVVIDNDLEWQVAD